MKTIKYIILPILVSLLCLTACNTFKTVVLLKKGKVAQKEFHITIPFEYRLGLIILKVSIADNEYDFLFDTGAANVVTKELAKKLGLAAVSEQKIDDSQGNNNNLGFVTIEQIDIGEINFLNTGAAIADLNSSSAFACLKIDGIIGANLMKKAIWKIDYKNQVITITNSIDALSIPETAYKVQFSQELTGTPLININLNGIVAKDVTIDSGSNRNIKLAKQDFYNLANTMPSLPKLTSFGNSSYGLYGIGKNDSTFTTIVPQVSLGDILLKNTIVKFKGKSTSIIGNKFFKNYDLIFNWFNNEIYFIEKEEYRNSTLFSFGFNHITKGDKFLIGEIFENSSAYNEGLQLGDQIIQINDVKYDKLSAEQTCQILDKGLAFEEKEISITVLRNNEELNFVLKKLKLL